MKSLSALSLSLLSLVVTQAHAESASDELQPVIVSATRSPETAGISSSHIQVIDQNEIKRSGARNLADLLRKTAVIQLFDSIGDGQTPAIGMRGFGENASQNSLLLIDGRRLNNDSDIGAPDLRNLSIDDIDHIEIINGSAGALYGSAAVGGIVNIITKPISREVRIGASRGSHDLESYRIRASERQGEIGIQAIGEKSLADNYRDRNEMNRGYQQGRITFDQDRFGLYAEASKQDVDQNLAGALTKSQVIANRRQAQYPDNFISSENQRYSAGVRFGILENWNLNVDASRRFDDSNSAMTYYGTLYSLTQNRDQTSINPRLTGSYQWGEQTLKLIFGHDRDSSKYHFNGLGPIDNRQHVRSNYAQIGWGVNKDIELVIAGRHAEYRSDLKDAFTYVNGVRISSNVDVGSAAIYWSPAARVKTWLRADQNFRFAAADEQTNIAFGTSTPLDTQKGISYEIGGEYRADDWRANLQLFQLDLEKEISYDAALYANVNLDDTRRKGANIQMDYQLLENLSLGAQAAWIDAKFTAGPNRDKSIPAVARDNETLNITWQSPWNASLVFEQQRLGSRHISSDYANSQPKLKALYLGNLAAYWKWERLETSLRLNNLFDRKYDASATLSNNSPAYVPAAERNLLVSIDYKLL